MSEEHTSIVVQGPDAHVVIVEQTAARQKKHRHEEPGKRGSAKEEESIASEIAWGVGLCVVLALLALGINRTEDGKQFQVFSYRVLQRRLEARPSRVTVVDIGNIPPEGSYGVTSREKLKMLLHGLSRKEPTVIGIDVDFSPELSNGRFQYVKGEIKYLTPYDPAFFTACQNVGPGKVILGIFRTQLLSPTVWLGDPKYHDLAADLWIPNDASKVPKALSVSRAAASGQEARTMSFALANPDEKVGRYWRFLKWLLVRTNPIRITEGVEIEGTYVDYSVLREGLSPSMLPVITLDPGNFASQRLLDEIISSHAEQIRGQRILIGDVSQATDLFADPADGRLVPGVLIQAAAANTMAGQPLYAFPEGTRFWVDLALALSIFAVWITLKHAYGPRIDEGRLLTLMIVLAAMAVISFALLVNVTHVLWDDFLFVALGLALHPVSHRTMNRCRGAFGSVLKSYLGRST